MENEKKKYPTPRGPAATMAKNKYRDKTYDRMELAMPKGTKQNIQEAVKALGYRSVNQFVERAVIEKYESEMGKPWEITPPEERNN